MKKNNLIFTLILCLFLAACGGEGKKSVSKKNTESEKENTEDNSNNPPISKEVLSDIVRSIPSPLEISFLIKDLGIQYDKNILNSTQKTANYNTAYKQALNLGVFSTDLGYANIYSQTKDALTYLKSVNEMADALNIAEFFDYAAIKDLATNSNNLDSLLLVTNMNLERINDHLQKKDRADLTILILTGGWLEALYLTCEVAKKQRNDLLNNRIGEQKIILDQLLLLLSFYEDDYPKVKELRVDLSELQKIYNNIKIEFNAVDDNTSTTRQENGILIVEDNTTTKINFTDQDLINILEKSKAIREKIIN